MAELLVTVQTESGQPVAGAGIRLVSQSGVDVTASVFGASPVFAGPDGIYRYVYGGNGNGNVLGPHVLTAFAPGFNSGSVPYLFLSPEINPHTIVLTRAGLDDEVEIDTPASAYVSPLFAVEFTAPGVSASAPWELIETTLTDENARESVMETAVLAGQAGVNVQARLIVPIGVHLVDDGQSARTDPDFVQTYEVTLASLTPAGRLAIDNQVSFYAANLYPTGDTNDLRNYTNLTGPADWIAPWGDSYENPLPKFGSRYADAMAWLPAGSGDVTLRVIQQTINRQPIETTNTTLPGTLWANKKSVRIRIPDALPTARYATLQLFRASTALTNLLYVEYHG